MTNDSYSCQAPRNPCSNVSIGTLFPIEGNCVNYLLCLEYGPERLECPAGYEFGVDAGKCVPKDEANCSGSTVTVPGGSTNESTITTPTTSNSTADIPVDLGKICSEHKRTFVPYPGNCSQFIICARNGIPSVRTCPEGQHFNPEKNCVLAEEANCDPSYSTATPTTTAHLTPPGPNSTLTPNTPDQNITFTPTTARPTPPDVNTTLTTTRSTPPDSNTTLTPSGSTLTPPSGESTTSHVTPPGEETTTTKPTTLDSTPTSESNLTPTTSHATPPGEDPTTEESTTVDGETTTLAPTTIDDPTDDFLEKACENKVPGSRVDFPGNCERYVECNNPPTWKQCSDSDYFSSQNGSCGLFQNSECALTSISCKDGKAVGQIPGVCNGYVICTANPPSFTPCNTGQTFDPTHGCVEGDCEGNP